MFYMSNSKLQDVDLKGKIIQNMAQTYGQGKGERYYWKFPQAYKHLGPNPI